MAFHKFASGFGRDLWILPLDTTDPEHPKAGTPYPFLQSRGNEVDASFSPNGRWLAYMTDESGTAQVFVRPFHPGQTDSDTSSAKWQRQISTSGGRFPIWSQNGKELFYETVSGQIMVTKYTVKGDSFIPETPREWSPARNTMTGVYQNLDLHPDGKRFVAVSRPDSASNSSLHATFLLNFFDEVRRRVQ